MKKKSLFVWILTLALAFSSAMTSSLFAAAAAAEAPLSFSVGSQHTFSPGMASVPILVMNNGNKEAVITGIEVLSGCDFEPVNMVVPNARIPANSPQIVYLNAFYKGTGTSLAIRVTSKIDTDTYLNNVNIGINGSAAPANSDGSAPKLYVTAVSAAGLMGGRTNNVTLSIANSSAGAAHNVVVQLAGAGDSAKYFTAGQGGTTLINPASLVSVSVPLTVSADIPGGSCILSYSITANSDDGTPSTFEGTTTVSVKARDLAALPYIKSISVQKTDETNPNRYKMTVVVANPGEFDIGKVSLSFGSQPTAGFSLYENFTPVSLGAITAGKEAQAAFSVYIDSSVAAGNYPLTFGLTYRSSDMTVDTKQDSTAYLELDGAGGSSSSTPRIIISNYHTSTGAITSGNTFKLSFTLKNTAKSTDVRNIKVVLSSGTVSSGGAVFVVAEGSNSFYIDSISKESEVTKSIQLVANQDAQPGIYPIMLAIDYEDEGGQTYSTTEQLSFAVSQEQRLETVGFTVMQNAMEGDMIPVSFQYINKGKATIYNLTIAAEGDFTLSGGDSYIGNLTAGQNDYFEDYMTVMGTGTKTGAIILKYESSDGTRQELRQEFTVEVSPMDYINPGDPNFPIDPVGPIEPEQTGMAWWIWALIGVGAAAAVTVIVAVSVKKAKKAKAANEEE